MTGGTSLAKSSAGPTCSPATAPARRSTSTSCTRLVDEHARRRRALLPGVAERRLDDRRDGLVEVGVGVDDDAVLAAHLGDDALELARAAARRRRRVRRSSRPTGPEPVNAIVATSGWRASAAPASPSPGSSAIAPGRHAARAQRLDDAQPAARRLLGGLQDDGVAGRERRGGHAHRDREREVPRRDDRADAARRVAQLVALAGHLQQRRAARRARSRRARRTRGSRSPRRRRRRPPARASRTRARRARRARARRSRIQAAARSSAAARSAAGVAAQAPNASRAAATAARGLVGRRARGERDDALGVAGVRRDELLAVAAVVADPDRHAQRQPELAERGARASRARSRGAARGPARWRTARAGRHAGGASSCSSGTPCAWSARKLSLAVFSSRRRTR